MRRILFLMAAIPAILSIFAFIVSSSNDTFIHNSNETFANDPRCSDSDANNAYPDGNNIGLSGRITCTSQSYSDFCHSDEYVVEYYYDQNINDLSYYYALCPDSQQCRDGACVSVSEPRANENRTIQRELCYDSDGGKDPFVKGVVSCGTARYADSCFDANTVHEYFNDLEINSYNSVNIHCGYARICDDGFCVPGSSPSNDRTTPIIPTSPDQPTPPIDPSQSPYLKVLLFEDVPTIQQDEDISSLEKIIIAKSPDLVVLHEDFFQGYTRIDSPNSPYVMVKDSLGGIEIEQGNDPLMYNQIKRLIGIAQAQKTVIVAPAIALGPNQEIKKTGAIIIGQSGKILAIYYKNEPFSEIILKTNEDITYKGVVQICTTLAEYQRLSENIQNANADILIHPAWGGWETLALPVMEYKQTGAISDETYSFLTNSPLHFALFTARGISSKSDLVERIEKNEPPFDWLGQFNDINSKSNVINSNGYLISADQITTNSVLNIAGKRLHYVEYGPGYSYLYAEIELPQNSGRCPDNSCSSSGSKNVLGNLLQGIQDFFNDLFTS